MSTTDEGFTGTCPTCGQRYLEGQLALARKALEFYANKDAWRYGQFQDIGNVIDEDGGDIAREALAKLDKEPK